MPDWEENSLKTIWSGIEKSIPIPLTPEKQQLSDLQKEVEWIHNNLKTGAQSISSDFGDFMKNIGDGLINVAETVVDFTIDPFWTTISGVKAATKGSDFFNYPKNLTNWENPTSPDNLVDSDDPFGLENPDGPDNLVDSDDPFGSKNPDGSDNLVNSENLSNSKINNPRNVLIKFRKRILSCLPEDVAEDENVINFLKSNNELLFEILRKSTLFNITNSLNPINNMKINGNKFVWSRKKIKLFSNDNDIETSEITSYSDYLQWAQINNIIELLQILIDIHRQGKVPTVDISELLWQESKIKEEMILIDAIVQNCLQDCFSNNENRRFSENFILFFDEKIKDWPNHEKNKEEELFFLDYQKNIDINISREAIQYYRIYYKFLSETLNNPSSISSELAPKLLHQKLLLEVLFKDMNRRLINYRRKELKDIEHRKLFRGYRERPRIKESPNGTSWDIKSLDPLDIVMWNKSIMQYIFSDKPDVLENINRPTKISIDSLKEWDKYQNLFKETINSDDFVPYKKYFNLETWEIEIKCKNRDGNDVTIDRNNIDQIQWETYYVDGDPLILSDLESLKEIKEDIDTRILRLARREQYFNFIAERRENINGEIDNHSVKMSSIMCCIRAIKSFFDTTNNNWENFASEFQIEDTNKNIDLKTENWNLILSMTWTINGKTVKLYYNITNWTISFDEFIALDENREYNIWWKNSKLSPKEVLTWLPTLWQMESLAKSIELPDVIKWWIRAKTATLFMSESIWYGQFLKNWGVNHEVNKLIVSNFNERNLLEQEIITCIYDNFYDWNALFNGNNPFIVWNDKQEQFKMITLIYNSIKRYWNDTIQLLRFRNCIAKLWEILQDSDKLWNCLLLDYLFLDNPNMWEDSYTETYNILKNENGGVTKNWKETENMNRLLQTQPTMIHNQENNKQINFYTLLNLFAEGDNKDNHINLVIFEDILNLIDRDTWDWPDPLSVYCEDDANDNVFTEKYPVWKVENGIIDVDW